MTNHVRHIAVLLPNRPESRPGAIFEDWADRQPGTVLFSRATRTAQGNHWNAYGVTEVERLRGMEIDEVVLSAPHIDHELIQEAYMRLCITAR